MADIATIGFGRDCFEAEHDAFRDSVRRFMRREVEPYVKEWEKEGFFPAELFRTAGKAGLLCAGIPEEYGGGGGDMRHQFVLWEEHAYTPAAFALEGGLLTDFASLAIYNAGTEEQKREWLPFFAQGDGIAEIGLSEPGAGSDAGAVTTFARRDGDDYIINGQKCWITNAQIMTVILCVARTKPPGEKDGLSVFIVPMDSPGVSRRETDLFLKSAGGVGEIFFDDVRVPARNLLGGVEGHGLRHALSLINIGRIGLACRCTAAMEVALAMTTDYVKTRKIFGQSVFDFQNTQFKLASIATDLAAARALTDRNVQLETEGRLSGVETAKAKLFVTETQFRVMDECLQLFGGTGVTNEFILSKMFNTARIQRIYAGTSEIMRNIIARSLA